MAIKILKIVLFIIIFVPVSCSSSVIHVPGDQTTIQTGINAAFDGDIILVADGTYTGEGNRDSTGESLAADDLDCMSSAKYDSHFKPPILGVKVSYERYFDISRVIPLSHRPAFSKSRG